MTKKDIRFSNEITHLFFDTLDIAVIRWYLRDKNKLKCIKIASSLSVTKGLIPEISNLTEEDRNNEIDELYARNLYTDEEIAHVKKYPSVIISNYNPADLLAFIIQGEQDGTFDSYNAAQRTEV